jgi:DNA modification methylase
VRAVLPLGQGIILDPFAGSGSTLAAANAVGYESIGIEKDTQYVTMARRAIPKLGTLIVQPIDPVAAFEHLAPGRNDFRIFSVR